MQTCSEAVQPVWRPADPLGGIWSAWPATGELRPEVSVHNLYTVHISLKRRVHDLDEITAVLAERIRPFHLMAASDNRGRTRLIITVETPDLWQAVLLTVHAVTSTGHVPVALTVEPSAETEDEVSSATGRWAVS